MVFPENELGYLAAHRLGRGATPGPDGTLQNSPVGYGLSADVSTVKVHGRGLGGTRNLDIIDAGCVALVVDDRASLNPWSVRCGELRGTAEAVRGQAAPRAGVGYRLRLLHVVWQTSRMAETAHGTFDVVITPGPAELGGRAARFELSKTFAGDLEARGAGLMLSAGDPARGAAGYVALEWVEGRLAGRDGGFALQQFGVMVAGSQTLRYEVVPGSGTGAFAGMTGSLDLTIEDGGAHRYALTYDL